MAKTLVIDGFEFVTNNFAAILDKADAPEAFHLVQDFLKIKFNRVCISTTGINFSKGCD